MATSGSFETNKISSFYFTFDWYRTGYDSSKNVHYIHYTVTAHNTPGYYRTVYLKNLWVAGQQVYYQAGTSGNGKAFYDGNVVTSGDMTISSYNSAGDGSFDASFEAGVGQYPSSNCSGSGSWNLDRIPRYLSSINIYSNGSALNSIGVKWTCDPRRDWTQYSLNGGGWTDAGDSVASDGKSGTFNIGGLSPNTSYNVKVRLRRADSALWSESGTITITTKNKATISSPADNFSINSDNSLTVKCSNPSGNQIAYFLDCPSGTRRLTSSKTTETNYTWNAAQILSMLQYFPNSNSSSIKVGIITYGNSEYYSEKVGTLNVVNSNPTFSEFTYQDTNSKTIALTGNNQILINNFSNIKAIISAANKATPKNYATMKSYKLACGTKNISKDYSSSSDVEMSLNSIDSSTITVYATDSRGNSTSKSKTATYKNYVELAITKLVATRQQNGVGTAVLLEFEGTYWNDNFGVVTNAITQCIYQYKLPNASSWITGTTQLSYSASNGKFMGSVLINGDLGTDGFNVSNAYNIKLQMADKLVVKAVDITLPSGSPGLAMAKKGVAIKQKYDNSLGGALQVNGILYVVDTTTGKFIDIVNKIKEIEKKV